MSTIVQAQTILALEPLEGFIYLQPDFSGKQLGPIVTEDELSSPFSEESASPISSTQDEVEHPDCGVQHQQTQSALVVTPDRQYQLVADFPAPQELGAHEVMIRNRATGLNHIDWKSVDYNFCLPELPWITGREMAGVVERVGSDVGKVTEGDLVWTSGWPVAVRFMAHQLTMLGTYYKDRRAGCFQDLVVVPEHTVFHIPSNLDFSSAACLGVAALTAGMSMWKWLGVPMHHPVNENSTETSEVLPPSREVILIWGGSTVTGQFAVQMASQAGLEIIAVCSSSTADLVASLGATHVVTYTGKTDFHIIGEILCLAQGRLSKAIDLVGAKTAKLVLQVIGACGAKQVDFAPLAFMSSKDPIPANATVHNVEMKQFVLNSESEVYGETLNQMVEQGRLKLPKLNILAGGLGAVEAGLQRVKEGNLAGEKLVVAF